MARLGREQLKLPADSVDALYLLEWTRLAEVQLRAELDDTALLTRQAALKLIYGLFTRLYGLCTNVFGELKNAYIVEAEPVLSIDPKLATLELRAAASERLLLELEQSGGECVFGRYPLLRGLLDRETARFAEAERELLGRLRRDREAICGRFFGGEDFGPVTALISDAGDQHFHGRSTCVIRTQRGAFMYKPRDCSVDARFRGLVQRHFSDVLRAPDCIACEGYGWCEYIKADEEQGSEAGVKRYYRRFGAVCALMQALGSSDLHSENWICSGGFPVLVDLETLLSPIPRVFNDKSVFPELVEDEGFLSDTNRSLVPSGLLPARAGERELSVLLDGSGSTDCQPVLDGRKRSVLGCEEDFLAGFSEGYDRCMALRDELLEALEGFRQLPVRKLMRNTDSYAKLLTRLSSGPALRSEENRLGITGRLCSFFSQHGAEHMLPIARWEEACLLEGDIPYFSAKGAGHALLGYDNVVVEDFFSKSAVENAQERIGRLSEEEKRFELGILRQSIERAVIPVQAERGEERGVQDFEPLSPGKALAAAEELFRLIDGMLLTGPSGSPSWLMLSERSSSLVSMRPDLSRGTTGLGVFFSAMYAAGGETACRASELAGICLDQLGDAVERLEAALRIPEEALTLGLTSGFAGAMTALELMERGLGSGRAAQLRLRLLALLDRAEVEKAGYMDVFSGAAGLVWALCRACEEDGAEQSFRQLARASERLLACRTLEHENRLLWDTLDKGWPISGAGHGMAGIAAALARAGKLLGDGRCMEAAKAALEFEHGIYSEKLGTWPDLRSSPVPMRAMHGLCSGAPGIGLALLACRESGLGSAELDTDLERAKRCCLDRRPLYRDHLCCGNSASVDFLLTLPDGREHAGRLLAFMLERAEAKGGFNYLPEGARSAPAPELFYGAAGVGYELLRYALPGRFPGLLF